MRVVLAGAIAAAMASGAVPGAAQTPGALNDPKALIPMPDTQGTDVDLLCFAVMASGANDAKAKSKPDTLLESAAGYYVGRLTVRYPDAGTSLRPAVSQLLRSMGKGNADAFKLPCLQQYGLNLTGVLAALQGGRADAK